MKLTAKILKLKFSESKCTRYSRNDDDLATNGDCLDGWYNCFWGIKIIKKERSLNGSFKG